MKNIERIKEWGCIVVNVSFFRQNLDYVIFRVAKKVFLQEKMTEASSIATNAKKTRCMCSKKGLTVRKVKRTEAGCPEIRVFMGIHDNMRKYNSLLMKMESF